MRRLSKEERERELDKLSWDESVKSNRLLSKIDKKIDDFEGQADTSRAANITLECVAGVMALPFSALLKKEGLHCLRRDRVRDKDNLKDYEECLKIIDAALAELDEESPP